MPGAGPRAGRGSPRSLRAREVQALLRDGRRYRSRRVVLYVAPSSGTTRAAFVAGRKVGGAVERNRARRILREAWRAMAPRTRGGLLVALVATGEIRGATTNDLIDEVRGLLDRAGLLP